MGCSSRADSKVSEDENLETSLDSSLVHDLDETEKSTRTVSNQMSDSRDSKRPTEVNIFYWLAYIINI